MSVKREQRGFLPQELPDIVTDIDNLPELQNDTIGHWEPVFVRVLVMQLGSNPNLANSLQKKARGSLRGKTDSPSTAEINAEIKAEFKRAIKRFVKERSKLLSEQ